MLGEIIGDNGFKWAMSGIKEIALTIWTEIIENPIISLVLLGLFYLARKIRTRHTW